MSLKIFDVPDGTEYLVAKDSRSRWIKSVRVSNLNDALTVAKNATVEKRVIELPADFLDELKVIKSRSNNVYDFLTDVYKSLTRGLANDLLANWYLGHVDFVAKEEPMFYVMTDFGTLDTLGKHGETLNSFETLDFLKVHGHYYKFTESKADELVDGLTALNARKVKVED